LRGRWLRQTDRFLRGRWLRQTDRFLRGRWLRQTDRPVAAIALSAAVVSAASPARALDTAETWDPGAFDLEAYARVEHSFEADRVVALDAVAGYGIVTRLSAYVAGAVEYGEGTWTVIPAVGVFGTPLDTDHVDLDLFLAVGYASREVALVPAFELNLDRAPDQAAWGVFFRGDSAVHDHWVIRDLDHPEPDVRWHLGLALGAYVAPAPGHQVLAMVDAAWAPDPGFAPESVALGYNVRLVPPLELITEVSFDDVVHRGARSPGFMAGVIVTVPPWSAAPD
jgi:hypothetical protein